MPYIIFKSWYAHWHAILFMISNTFFKKDFILSKSIIIHKLLPFTHMATEILQTKASVSKRNNTIGKRKLEDEEGIAQEQLHASSELTPTNSRRIQAPAIPLCFKRPKARQQVTSPYRLSPQSSRIAPCLGFGFRVENISHRVLRVECNGAEFKVQGLTIFSYENFHINYFRILFNSIFLI